jgi:ATP-dependent RNA helicase DHX57
MALKELRDSHRAAGISDDVITAIQAISRSGRIDYTVISIIFFAATLIDYFIESQLIAALVAHIIRTAEKRGGILIFLPGVHEIRQCIEAVLEIISQKDATVLPLHANLSNNEQRAVFEPTNSWKIIAATNVAEVRLLFT